jgi:hypothetical protein
MYSCLLSTVTPIPKGIMRILLIAQIIEALFKFLFTASCLIMLFFIDITINLCLQNCNSVQTVQLYQHVSNCFEGNISMLCN